jgi:two-component system, NtrC family, nitrogen regulation sensor histidine kinase NtrY
MANALTSASRRSPRIWRRLLIASRRANFFFWLEVVAAIIFVLMVGTTWLAFTSAPPGGQLLPSTQVASLLIGTLLPAMTLVVLFGRRMAIRHAAGGTARLHVRLVFFFSLVAAVPTLLVAAFAAFLFQSGADFWFSDQSRGLMRNANELAHEYYVKNHLEVGRQTTTMASDLRFHFENADEVSFTDSEFVEFINYQMQAREINEIAILQEVDDGSLRTVATYNITAESEPGVFGTAQLAGLKAGEPVAVVAENSRLQAVAPIDVSNGVFLFTVRNL